MNIPNRNSVNTTSAPGNRHLDSTYPLSDPSTAEINAPGTATLKLFASPGEISSHAVRHPSRLQWLGNAQACDGSVSEDCLKLVTTSTYTGSTKKSTKNSSSTKRPVFQARCLRTALTPACCEAPFSTATAVNASSPIARTTPDTAPRTPRPPTGCTHRPSPRSPRHHGHRPAAT